MLWSIKINSELDYCLYICYQLFCTLLAAADGNGCRFGHHRCRQTSQIREHAEVDRNKLMTTLIYWFYQTPSTAVLEQTWARPPATWMSWNHQIHAAGGASGSITMVVVFVGCLCCCGWTRDVTSSSYVKNGTKITSRWGWRHYFLIHLGVHPTSRCPSKSARRNSMREFQKVWWISALLWLVKSRFDGRIWWPYFAHWKASPYTNTGIGMLVFIVNKLCSTSWVTCVTSDPIAS